MNFQNHIQNTLAKVRAHLAEQRSKTYSPQAAGLMHTWARDVVDALTPEEQDQIYLETMKAMGFEFPSIASALEAKKD